VSPTPPYRDDAHAVVIGINQYQDLGIPDLHFARADAEAVYAVLTDPEIGRFNPESVTLLVDEEATERRIRSAIGSRLSKRAEPGHTVFVYYAGHGAPVIDPRSKSSDGMEKYLIPQDAVADDLRSSAIPMHAIQQFFDWIHASQVVFFIDTCYSGGAGGRSFDIPGFQRRAGILSDEFLDGLVENEGRYVVTACSPNEVSLETPDLGHGIFTHYLVEGLKGGADADVNGLVTLDELYEYIHRQVSRHARSLGGSMTPVRKGSARGSVYLTQYETAAQRRSREAGTAAAAAFGRDEFDEAERLWEEALRFNPENPAARDGIASMRARREETERQRLEVELRQKELLDGRLSVLRRCQKSGELSKQFFAQAVELLERDTSELTDEERDRREFVEHLTDGQITCSQYIRAIKVLSTAPSATALLKAKMEAQIEPRGAVLPPATSVPEVDKAVNKTPAARSEEIVGEVQIGGQGNKPAVFVDEVVNSDGDRETDSTPAGWRDVEQRLGILGPSPTVDAVPQVASKATPEVEPAALAKKGGTSDDPPRPRRASRWQDSENPPNLFVPSSFAPSSLSIANEKVIAAVLMIALIFLGWIIVNSDSTSSDESSYPYTSSDELGAAPEASDTNTGAAPSGGVTTTVTSDTTVSSATGTPAADNSVTVPPVRRSNGPFSGWEVSTPAKYLSGWDFRSPDSLLTGPKESVLAEFIVDTFGIPEVETIHLRSLAETQIVELVRAQIPQMRYQPARAEGRKVRQYEVQIWNFTGKTPQGWVPAAGPGLGEKRLLGAHWLNYNHCCGTGVAMVRPENGELSLWGRIKAETDSVFLSGKVSIVDENTFYLEGRIVTTVAESQSPCVRRGRFTFKIRGDRRYWRLQQISNPCSDITDYVDIYY
jgi:uncharacterized caspase-like protein